MSMRGNPGAALAAKRKRSVKFCDACGQRMNGLRWQKYCSATCRQRAHRQSRGIPPAPPRRDRDTGGGFRPLSTTLPNQRRGGAPHDEDDDTAD